MKSAISSLLAPFLADVDAMMAKEISFAANVSKYMRVRGALEVSAASPTINMREVPFTVRTPRSEMR